ncbi:hypothetical protein BpHYR1_045451 [Brachionus plicatilis]|uniref:Uncharacterized protein n=1 Tax=Brachionus plicatilis TaxID=10195 RepID=A0A3M7T4A8_BRAPC|nr:hypothetical protein BpHYR1_045451 [Brachionus plicatilis]
MSSDMIILNSLNSKAATRAILGVGPSIVDLQHKQKQQSQQQQQSLTKQSPFTTLPLKPILFGGTELHKSESVHQHQYSSFLNSQPLLGTLGSSAKTYPASQPLVRMPRLSMRMKQRELHFS